MSRLIVHGGSLEDLDDDELLEFKRDVEMAREAVVAGYDEATAAAGYDEDLEEISAEIRSRPGLSERPALPRPAFNPFMGHIRVERPN